MKLSRQVETLKVKGFYGKSLSQVMGIKYGYECWYAHALNNNKEPYILLQYIYIPSTGQCVNVEFKSKNKYLNTYIFTHSSIILSVYSLTFIHNRLNSM